MVETMYIDINAELRTKAKMTLSKSFQADKYCSLIKNYKKMLESIKISSF